MVKTIAVVIALFLLGSCNSPDSPDCFKSRGSNTTEVRTLDSFNAVEVRDYLNIILVDAEEFKVEISGGKNLLKKIETKVESGNLIIDNKNTCNWVRSLSHEIDVKVFCPEFNRVILQDGAGNLRSLGALDGNEFLLETNHASGDVQIELYYGKAVFHFPTGTSDAFLTGETDQLEIFSDAFGSVNASGLSAPIVLVNNSSINDFHITTTNYFYAEINDRGNIYVGGTISHYDINDNGAGEVVILE